MRKTRKTRKRVRRLTEAQLRKIIRQEVRHLSESALPTLVYSSDEGGSGRIVLTPDMLVTQYGHGKIDLGDPEDLEFLVRVLSDDGDIEGDPSDPTFDYYVE